MAETGVSPVYYVLSHSPGPRWRPGVSFQEQPGVKGGLLRVLVRPWMRVMKGEIE